MTWLAASATGGVVNGDSMGSNAAEGIDRRTGGFSGCICQGYDYCGIDGHVPLASPS